MIARARSDITPVVSSADDEATLWAAFVTGKSSSARSRLFTLHAPFARRIAKRHFLGRKGGDIEYPDLCQLAYAGLLEAIDRFDPAKGAPFRGYAARRITGSVLDGVSKTSEMRQQASYRNRVRYERARSLMAGDGAASEQAPLAEAMRLFEELTIGLALGFMLDGTGLYQSEEGPDLRETGAYESLAWGDSVRQLTDAVESLPEREQAVIRGHYLEDLDFAQVAALLGVGKARISQLHRSGIALLKKRLAAQPDFRLER